MSVVAFWRRLVSLEHHLTSLQRHSIRIGLKTGKIIFLNNIGGEVQSREFFPVDPFTIVRLEASVIC